MPKPLDSLIGLRLLVATSAACRRRLTLAAISNHAGMSQVVDGEHTGMKGVQTAIAKYGISSDKPNRQDVTFTGIRIEADPNTDMQQWLGAMKNANSNMVSILPLCPTWTLVQRFEVLDSHEVYIAFADCTPG